MRLRYSKVLRKIKEKVFRKSGYGRMFELTGSRQARLMYMSSTRGGYCSVYGALSVVSDADSRRHYWKNHWAAAFLPEAASEPEGVQKVHEV
eukprot:398351-Amphidinium_carterae.1